MPGLYVGSTGAYSGKNVIIVGLALSLRKAGYKVAYFKPVGAQIGEREGLAGDEDAFVIREALGLKADPGLITPVLVTQDFISRAFTAEPLPDLRPEIVGAYRRVSEGADVTLIGGSGSFLHSGKYCGLDGGSVVKALGVKTLIIDRFAGELNYDALLSLREALGESLLGCVLNDVPSYFRDEMLRVFVPFLAARGVATLGIVPCDRLLAAISVGELAERLGATLLNAPKTGSRLVESFLIGTMQVENFLTHFRKQPQAAVIVGGDRTDLQLVAIEGDCTCLILTGNLYPSDFVLARAEDAGTPILVVRDDTYTTAKRMEHLLARHKLRDPAKIRQAAAMVAAHVDLRAIEQGLGMK
jgi:hypothetical protein